MSARQCISRYKANLPVNHASRISATLINIPHTGTIYTLRLLRDRMGVGVRHSHISWPRDIGHVDELGRGAITTTRDPRKVAISMIGRNERLNPRLWEVIRRWAPLPRVCVWDVEHSEKRELADFVGYLGPLEPFTERPKTLPNGERAHDNSHGDPHGLKAVYAAGGMDERVEDYAAAVRDIYWREEWDG